jgi:hypothetical protein
LGDGHSSAGDLAPFMLGILDLKTVEGASESYGPSDVSNLFSTVYASSVVLGSSSTTIGTTFFGFLSFVISF